MFHLFFHSLKKGKCRKLAARKNVKKVYVNLLVVQHQKYLKFILERNNFVSSVQLFLFTEVAFHGTDRNCGVSCYDQRQNK